MLKGTAYALVLAFGVLLLVEIGLRLYIPAPNEKSDFVRHPLFDKIRRPGFSTETEAFGKRFVFRINDLGLRGPPMSLQKPSGTYRIIFVGGSVVENRFLPEEETFPILVGRELNERLGGVPRVEVGILAKPAATSEMVLAQIANNVLELSPDLVVVQSAADWLLSVHPDYEPTLAYMARELNPRMPFLQAIERTLQDTRLVQVVQELRPPRNRTSKLARAQAARRSVPFRDPPDSHFERGLKRYWWNLHRSGLLCRDAGVAFALITKVWLYKVEQPPEENDALWGSYLAANVRAGGWNVSPLVARRWVDRYNDVVRDVAGADDFILFDFAKTIPNNLVNLVDDVHLTTAGNLAFAKAIVSELLRGGTLPQATDPKRRDPAASNASRD